VTRKGITDMPKRSRAYIEAASKITEGKYYLPAEAVALVRETGSKKFDSTIEVAVKLGVDPRKADQMIRGTVSLPHGTGKTARVIVFATGPAADAARAAGADEVGGDELIEKVAAGWVDFDSAVSTPELMGKVGRLGKVLGPRNLMPNPKTGTVTPDTAKAVSDIKGGKIEFRIDKQSNLHFIIGKASFTAKQLEENLGSALDEIQRLKPSSSKGKYMIKAAVSTTFGPGILLDTTVAKA
jgi:large subunit ribosomal protein L1